MSRFAVFIKHFSGSLPSCRDRPLHITNNVSVQPANQIAYVTWPQTHRVVYLWPMDSKFLKNKHLDMRQCIRGSIPNRFCIGCDRTREII